MTPLDPPPRLWPYLLINAVAACCLALSSLQRLQSADTMIFYLSSLYEPRLFFWEQDRVGMLIPLLASWCRSPFHNLLLQTGAMAFAGLTAPLLLARVLTPHGFALAAATLSTAAFLAFAPEIWIENAFFVCNYPCALALGLLAILIVEGGRPGEPLPRGALRAVACVALCCAAVWQYMGVVLYLVPLVPLRAWLRSPAGGEPLWRKPLRPVIARASATVLAAFGVALVFVFGLMEYSRDANPGAYPNSASGLPIAQWGSNWLPFGEAIMRPAEAWWFLGGYLGLSVLGILTGVVANGRAVAAVVWGVLPALLAAAAEFALLGTRGWPSQNCYHPRYLVAVVASVVVAFAAVGFAPLFGRLFRHNSGVATTIVGVLLISAVVFRFGPPSVRGVRTTLNENCGALTPAVLETGSEAIGGEYWTVWPAMFHANMTLYERGEGRAVFGVTHRSNPFRPWWQSHPQGFRIVVPEPQLAVGEGYGTGRGLRPYLRAAGAGTIRPEWHYFSKEERVHVSVYFTAPREP